MYMRCFFFIIPIRATPARSYHPQTVEVSLNPRTQESIQTQTTTAPSILIVEDNQLVTQALRTFLDKAGYAVSAFES